MQLNSLLQVLRGQGSELVRKLQIGAYDKPGKFSIFPYSARYAADRLVIQENFLQRPGIAANISAPAADTYSTATAELNIDKNKAWLVQGTNMTSALATFAAGGGVTLTTAGASADQGILAPHSKTGESAWNAITFKTDDKLEFDVRIKTGANITAATIWAGFKLTNTGTTATDDDQVFFRYQDTVNSGKWQAVDSTGGTDNAQDTGITAAVSTAYHLLITVDANRIPRYYINDALVAKGNALTTGVTLIPFIGVQAGAAAAKAVTVRRIICAKAFND